MITPQKLFYKRLISEWQYNFSIWRTVIDWTVALYIIFPFAAFGIHNYFAWWKNPPLWLEVIPVSVFLTVFFLFACSGTIRVFFREADELFLWSHRKWTEAVMIKGIVYSILLNLLMTFFIFLILAPFFLRYYQVSLYSLVCLLFITFMFRVFIGLLKQMLALYFCGYMYFFINTGMYICAGIVFLKLGAYTLINTNLNLIFILSLFILMFLLIRTRVKKRFNFFDEVDREQEARLRHVNMILGLAGVNSIRSKKKQKRPWLFRKSNHIFKTRTDLNCLVEVFIKATLRNKQRVWQYFQMELVCSLVVIAFPISIKWFVWLSLGFILTSFISLFWLEIMSSGFVRLFPVKTKDRYLASQKYVLLMTLPGFMLISIVAGFSEYSWIGALIGVVLSIGAVYSMSRLIAFYLGIKG